MLKDVGVNVQETSDGEHKTGDKSRASWREGEVSAFTPLLTLTHTVHNAHKHTETNGQSHDEQMEKKLLAAGLSWLGSASNTATSPQARSSIIIAHAHHRALLSMPSALRLCRTTNQPASQAFFTRATHPSPPFHLLFHSTSQSNSHVALRVWAGRDGHSHRGRQPSRGPRR